MFQCMQTIIKMAISIASVPSKTNFCVEHWSKLVGATNKAVFDLADIAKVISDEIWMSAKVGEMNYNSSH